MIKAIIKYALGLLMALISGYIIRIYMCQWFGIAEPTIIHSLFIGVLGFCVGIWVVMIKNYQIKKVPLLSLLYKWQSSALSAFPAIDKATQNR